MNSPGELKNIFCDRNQIKSYAISFHDSPETLEWTLCRSELLYNQTYQQFIEQYGKPIQMKVNSQKLFEN